MISRKARNGRHRNPAPCKSHHKPAEYSRVGRLLKQRMALLFAPKVSDYDDLDRPRLGLSEREVARGLWPQGDVVVVSTQHINSGRAAVTAARTTHQEEPR